MMYLRKACYDDLDLLFAWTNDPETRQNSFSTDYISYDEHCKWFGKMMDNENRIQYILMRGNTPIGQIRLDINKDCADISYSIDATQRGKGYGKKILSLINEEVMLRYPHIKILCGQVKPNNIASSKAFTSVGYAEKFMQYEIRIVRD